MAAVAEPLGKMCSLRRVEGTWALCLISVYNSMVCVLWGELLSLEILSFFKVYFGYIRHEAYFVRIETIWH